MIEILVVIGIFVVLSGLGLFLSLDFFRTHTANSEQVTLVSALSKARARSLANVDQNWHGVYIDTSSYVLFQGDNATQNYTNRDSTLDESIPFGSSVSTATGLEVVFDRLTGNTTCSPLCDFTMGSSGITETVSINAQGAILW